MKKGVILITILLFVFTSISFSESRIEKTNSYISPSIQCESSDKTSSQQENALLILEESEEESEARVRISPVPLMAIITEVTIPVLISSTPSFLKLFKQNYHIEIPLSLRAPPTIINYLS